MWLSGWLIWIWPKCRKPMLSLQWLYNMKKILPDHSFSFKNKLGKSPESSTNFLQVLRHQKLVKVGQRDSANIRKRAERCWTKRFNSGHLQISRQVRGDVKQSAPILAFFCNEPLQSVCCKSSCPNSDLLHYYATRPRQRETLRCN